MIEVISQKIAVRIKEANPEHPASVEVLRYAMASVINITGTFVLAVLIGFLLGQTTDTILALAAFAILRSISGGYHLQSSIHCLVISAVVANIIPLISISDPVLVICTIISATLALFFAPSNIKRSSRIPARFYPLLKFLSMAIILCNLFLYSEVIACCFLLQSVLLIHLGGEKQ